MEKQTGFSSEELIGIKPPYPWWTEDMLDRFIAGLEKIRRGVASRAVERLFQKKNGERFWVQISSVLVRDNDTPECYFATWVDITERKWAEEALRESEDTARALLNATTDSAMLINLEGNILAINRIGARRFGSSVHELVGSNVFDLIPPILAKSRKERIDKVIRSGKATRFEDEFGGLVFENNIYPAFDTMGKVVRLAFFARDITQRKLVEKNIRTAFHELIATIRTIVPVTEPLAVSFLTPREKAVVQLLAEGKSTKEISLELKLSVKTIETHRNRTMRKLGIHSIAELTKFAVREGLTAL
jgi:PAS domain S-box-containing protein